MFSSVVEYILMVSTASISEDLLTAEMQSISGIRAREAGGVIAATVLS